jgi:hypothetical protein
MMRNVIICSLLFIIKYYCGGQATEGEMKGAFSTYGCGAIHTTLESGHLKERGHLA